MQKDCAAFVSTEKFVGHGCCVYRLFALGLCMWYKCTCEESHVVDAYLSHYVQCEFCMVCWIMPYATFLEVNTRVLLKSLSPWGNAFCSSACYQACAFVDFMYPYIWCLDLPHIASLSLLVSLYYIQCTHHAWEALTAIFAVVWPVTHIGWEDCVRMVHVVCCTTTTQPHHWSRGVQCWEMNDREACLNSWHLQ